MKAQKGGTRESFGLVEKSDPDLVRVEEGMRLLGRMVAQALARDAARTSDHIAPFEHHVRETGDTLGLPTVACDEGGV